MKRGTIQHPKTIRLSELLGISHRDAVGLMEMLWHWTAEYASAGDIGRWTDRQIADAVQWSGDPAKLIDGLCDCGPKTSAGYLDRCANVRLVVHDWSEHCPEYVRKRAQRGTMAFVTAKPKRCKSRQNKAPTVQTCPDMSATRPEMSMTEGESVCPPILSQPNPTQPAPAASRPTCPYYEGFRAAYDEHFPEPYENSTGDFVQLARWKKSHVSILAERFVEVVRWHWEQEYGLSAALTVRGACTSWSKLAAKMSKVAAPASNEPTSPAFSTGPGGR